MSSFKRFSRISALLLLTGLCGWGAGAACEPPRPQENTPLDLRSDDGSGGRTNGPGSGSGRGGQGGNEGGSTAACGSGPDPTLDFSKSDLLRSAGQCAQRRYCEFGAVASALHDAAKAYAGDQSEETTNALREAFFRAMYAWSIAELFQFGPAASVKQDMDNGQSIRVLTYGWPSSTRCAVEEQIVSREYETEGFDDFVAVPVSSRGLFAVEYLIFYEGNDNVCPSFSSINSDGAWDALSEDELNEAKRDYLVAVTGDVLAQAQRLDQLWSPDGGDFEGQLATASAYMSEQEALNIVAHALLYAEVEIKDYKVGSPAGLFSSPEVVGVSEVPFAGGSTDQIRANLKGFRDLFQGCGGDALGFDDWLEEASHGDLSSDILAALDGAEEVLDGFPELPDASQTQLEELHAALKVLTDLLKGDLFGQGSPIGLTLPTAVEGDTD